MFNKYIKRNVEKVINNYKKMFPVIMITGSRQVGKTTLLNSLDEIKNINYVSLDDMKERVLAKEDPELFLKTHEFPLIIDEFQYAPDLLSYIKIIVDKRRLECLKNGVEMDETLFYLTGSQIFHTMKDVSESLAGRVGVIDLYGLTTRELNNSDEEAFIPDINLLKKKYKYNRVSVNSLFDRILKGSFPEIYKNSNMNFESFYSSYITTYIERDIRDLINVKDENKFMKFITSVAARTGCELNITDIANSIDITNVTAENWLSILKNTGLVYLLQPYFNNDINRIIKRPKIYFMDTGLASYLTGYTDSKTLERSAYNGAIFETYIISEIVKSYANNGIDSRKHLFYYRDSNSKEIDLLVIHNNVLYPVEIKKSTNPGIRAVKNFNVLKKLNIEIGNGTVICMCDNIFPLDDNNYEVPIEYI